MKATLNFDLHALHEGDGVSLEHDAAQLFAFIALHVHLIDAKTGRGNSHKDCSDWPDTLKKRREGKHNVQRTGRLDGFEINWQVLPSSQHHTLSISRNPKAMVFIPVAAAVPPVRTYLFRFIQDQVHVLVEAEDLSLYPHLGVLVKPDLHPRSLYSGGVVASDGIR